MSNIARHGGIRTWYIPGVGEVSKIVLYSGGNVHAEINRGWMEHTELTPGDTHIASCHSPYDVTEIQVSDPKRANKVNLSRTDHHFMRGEDRYSGKGYTLYLYAPSFAIIGERCTYEGETSRHFAMFAKIKLPHRRLSLTNGVGGWEEEIVFPVNSRNEETAFGAEIKNTAERLKAQGIMEKSNYNQDAMLQELLKFYTLTPRLTEQGIVKAAKATFPHQHAEARNTPEGWELLIGDEGEHCFAVAQTDTGNIEFDQRD